MYIELYKLVTGTWRVLLYFALMSSLIGFTVLILNIFGMGGLIILIFLGVTLIAGYFIGDDMFREKYGDPDYDE